MKDYQVLNLGFADAVNYKKRENKKLLNKYFVENEELIKLFNPNIYFLIGDKGTGKTAFSVYLANNEIRDTISYISYINETEYVKFIKLKNENHLELSDYTNIWKVLLYLLLSIQILKGETNLIERFSKYKKLHDAIKAFYNSAFSPELIHAINIIEQSKVAAELFHSIVKASGEVQQSKSYSESTFQVNLLSLQRIFEESLSSLKLNKHHFLFIDGIDIRPRNIEFEDYLECVKGLAQAAWDLNNNFFSNIKDSKGRIKIILLVRPDIFSHLGLQNLNNKIRDNSVLLDWKTTYPSYKSSSIFKIADRLLSSQQEKEYDLGQCWEHYFPFKHSSKDGRKDDSFIQFLRFSTFRPRDIITMMCILQENIKAEVGRKYPFIDELDFDSASFRSQYSDYLLGEIKDYLAFYHSDSDYELFLKFFEFLRGKASFSYDDYIQAYENYADYIENNHIDPPRFFESSDRFLQFLYDLNIISYKKITEDGERYVRWSYRERTYSNVNPKVQEGGVIYTIHYGLQKAFDTGKHFIQRRTIHKRNKRYGKKTIK